MTAQRISFHIAEDRLERATIILERIGLGEELYTRSWIDSTGRECLRTLTTTGVILCKNKETRMVTTLFVATPRQVQKLYGQNHCPDYIYSIVKKNQVRFKDIL